MNYKDDYRSEIEFDIDQAHEKESIEIEDSLSERVLQWLDMCGKDVTCNYKENANILELQSDDKFRKKKKIIKQVVNQVKAPEISEFEKQNHSKRIQKIEKSRSPRWIPSKKPQLHIFIPNLNATSSSESLNYIQ